MRLNCFCSWQEKKDSAFCLPNLKKSKFKSCIDCIIVILFGASFFSIPSLSFINGLNSITWILTILLFAFIFLDLLFFDGFKFDFISLSFCLFSLLALFSSAINGFENFVLTPIFLSVVSLVVYTFLLSNKSLIKWMAIAAYFGAILFLFLYIFQYRNELISLNFDRLGGVFGDENDIAIFMSFGFVFSLYILFFVKNTLFKFLSTPFILLFALCGFSSGSKIVLLVYVIIISVCLFLLFGKKKWWVVVIILLCFIFFTILFLNLPFMETTRDRLLDFISTLFGLKISGANSAEISTMDRFAMFENGITMFLQKPLFGWGISGFSNFGGFNGGWSHNHISETLCNFGLIGSLFFHMGFIFYIYNIFKKKEIHKFSFVFLIFFVSIMISVALNSQKIYAYFCPIIFIHCRSENFIAINVLFKNNRSEVKNYV